MKNKKVSVMVFSAAWCVGCISIKPILKELEDKFNITYIDVDNPLNNELAQYFKIKTIPTLIVNSGYSDKWLKIKGGNHTLEELTLEIETFAMEQQLEHAVKCQQLEDLFNLGEDEEL